jgi:hypothetical protein
MITAKWKGFLPVKCVILPTPKNFFLRGHLADSKQVLGVPVSCSMYAFDMALIWL